MTAQRFATTDGIEVVIRPACGRHQANFIVLLTVWILLNAYPRAGPPRGIPRRPYLLVVRDTRTGRVIYQEGVFRGGEAIESAEEFAREIERTGVNDFVIARKARKAGFSGK